MTDQPRTFEHKGRQQVHEVTLDGTPEQVWNAIATSEGLTSWYVEQAKVTPGEGNSMWISWGGEMAGEVTHLAWQPGERLVVGDPDYLNQTGWAAILQEWTIRSEGGKSVLRLVQSGIPDDGSWDNEYECTSIGWRGFLNGLRHALGLGDGARRKLIYRYGAAPRGPAELWARLGSSTVLGLSKSIDELSVGDRVVISAGNAEQPAVVADLEPERLLQLVLPVTGSAFLTVDMTGTGEQSAVNATLGVFGAAADRFEELQASWGGVFDALLASD